MLLLKKKSVKNLGIPKYQISYLLNTVLFSLGVEKDKTQKDLCKHIKEVQEIIILLQADGSVQRFSYYLKKYLPLSSEGTVPAMVVSQYLFYC